MKTNELVIEAAGLRKRFGGVSALEGLDLSVRRGEVHGFLGPNGAGKSTTLRVLLGLLRLDGGTVTLLGGDPWRDATELHKRLAYVPGDVSLWPELTGGEVLDLFSRLRGAPDLARRKALCERFDLDVRKRCGTYSKGNRQKVALVSALSSNAELLLLDEPTSGLDPLMEANFRECVAEEKARGRTVLLSSHVLAEVEALCDRVSIVRAGRVVEHGTLAELRHLTRSTVRAELAAPAPALASLPGVHDFLSEGASVRFSVEPSALDAALRALTSAGVRALQCAPPTLEDLFLRHYRAAGERAS